MKGNPSKQNKSKYYCFHRDHGHNTDECYDLKQQGKLKNFLGRDHKDERQPMKGKAEEPSRPLLWEIRIIVGGTSTGSSSKAKKTYLREVQNVQISGRPLRMIRADEPTIVFTDEDSRQLHVRDCAPSPLLWGVRPNPHEWVELCYCLSKWRFDWLFFHL